MLPSLVGAGRAHELMMTALRFDAEEVLSVAMLADAVPPDERAVDMSRATGSPH
jgi:enoyl-CoA hydratase